MGSRKVNTEGIDEELLIASIGRRRQDGTLYHAQEPPAPAPEEESVPETEPPPVQYTAKEKPQRDTVRRKRQEDDYSGLFLRRNEIKTRQCVYISRDVHSKILKIVNDIAGREISVGGYVDTVLRQHLEQHKEKINELYKKQPEKGFSVCFSYIQFIEYGREISMFVPFPISLSIKIFPLCSAAPCLTIESPKPVPPFSAERLASTR